MKLKKTLETMTKSSEESSLKKIMNYVSCLLSDFNKYEALEMLDHCDMLLRIPSTSDRTFIAWFTRRCVASWMHPVTSLEASSFAFWATKTTRKSLTVW